MSLLWSILGRPWVNYSQSHVDLSRSKVKLSLSGVNFGQLQLHLGQSLVDIEVPSHKQAAPTISRLPPPVGNCWELPGNVSGIVRKCRDVENIPKIQFFEILFKHRHVTPRWKSFGLSIDKEMTILGHFDLLGPKNGPKRVNMDWKYNFLKFCSNIGMWPLVGNGLASRSWIKWFWAILTYLGRFFSFFRSLSQAAPTIPDIYRPSGIVGKCREMSGNEEIVFRLFSQ